MLQSALKTAATISLASCLLLGCSSDEPAGTEPASSSVTEAATTVSGVNEASESERFHVFLEENYAVDMARNPFTASYRGNKLNHGQWDSVAEMHQQATREINAARLQQLQQFDRSAMNETDQLSYDLYQLDLERQLASDDFRHHHFVINQFWGPHTSAPSNLINIHSVGNIADAEAYISRLQNISTWFDEVIDQLAIRDKQGLLLADWQYPQIIQSARNVISGAPFDDSAEDASLWADFQQKVAALDIDDEQKEQLLNDARNALLDKVLPAYQRLIDALQQQSAKATGDDGVWKFPRGDAYYAQLLNWYTTTDLTADEIHAIGLREVNSIHQAMREIMAEVEFDGSLAEFFAYMRDEPRFYYADTQAGRDAYLNETRSLIDAMRQRLPEQFGLLPKAELRIKAVEAFREKTAGKAFYQSPPPDGSRPGIYYVNLHDMSYMPVYQMPALAYHEGLPGHHMQLAITAELQGIPEFQRYANFTAYAEGWGLYAEELASDMGMYPDPYAEFGRLAMALWRACRLVVDTGIHSKRWSREQAIDYLVENTPNPRGDSVRAIERYIALPGQATAYMIGKLKIVELREKARTALGDEFDIRQFHDEVLRHGPIPLSLLEQNIDRMIARVKEDKT
tara:strand:- start:84482 stop:86362 length:1881 start_codon:yes stop_codon:yes gene_type:complete